VANVPQPVAAALRPIPRHRGSGLAPFQAPFRVTPDLGTPRGATGNATGAVGLPGWTPLGPPEDPAAPGA